MRSASILFLTSLFTLQAFHDLIIIDDIILQLKSDFITYEPKDVKGIELTWFIIL